MTRLYQFIVAGSLLALAANSCHAAPPYVPKLSPVQVPPNTTPVILQFEGDRVIAFADVANPAKNLAFVKSGGTWLLIEGESVQLFITNGPSPTPGPGPQPPGPTPLNPRGAKYRDLAAVAADATRAATAQKLAAGYLAVANGSYADSAAMAAATSAAAIAAIPSNAVAGWQSFRSTLSEDWNGLLRLPSTNADFASLLRDAAAGLTASSLTP